MISKLTCPECSKTLKLPRPVSAGKKVKCPKCEAVFTARDDEDEDDLDEDEDERPRKPAKKPAPAAKKPPPKKEEPKKEEKKEEEIYGYVKEEEPEEEEEDEEDEDDDEDDRPRKKKEKKGKKPTINYAPDESIKDLRGPAQMLITKPANMLALVGFAGVFGWLAVVLLLVWPALFPISQDKEKKRAVAKVDVGLSKVSLAGTGVGENKGQQPGGGGGGASVKLEKETDYYMVFGTDIIQICDFSPGIFMLVLIAPVLAMVMSGLISVGAIKLQNMESRRWGVVAGIMALLPLNVGGVGILLSIIINHAFSFLEDPAYLVTLSGFAFFAAWGASLFMGGNVLKICFDEKVKAGFEYKAE